MLSKETDLKFKVGKKFVEYGADIIGEIDGDDAIKTAYNIGALMASLENDIKKMIDEMEGSNDR